MCDTASSEAELLLLPETVSSYAMLPNAFVITCILILAFWPIRDESQTAPLDNSD